MKITVIGAGHLGSALSLNLSYYQKKVTLWNRTPITKKIIWQRYSSVISEEVFRDFSQNLEIEPSLVEAINRSDILLICIKAQKVNSFLKMHYKMMRSIPIVFCSKGIDKNNLLLQTDIGRKYLNDRYFGVLTGPGFATDIIALKPIALSLACKKKKLGIFLQDALSTQSIRPYLVNDLIGAQIGGSLKNVIAIACGISDGKGLGDSTRTAVMTRGFQEMQKISWALGGRHNTLMGLAGLGDLTLTCNSKISRNYKYGFRIGSKRVKQFNETVEGKDTAYAAYLIAKSHKIDAPIIKLVNYVIQEKITVDHAIKKLIARPLKNEFLN